MIQSHPSQMKQNLQILLGLVLTLFSPFTDCAEGNCFIKNGDRIGFFGDSITAHKVYGEMVERVFRHAHPDANVTFVNNGQSGLKLSNTKIETVVKGDPNVITIMIGMNDAINSLWVQGDPIEPKVEQYRTELTSLVRRLKEKGTTVVILSPTLTDETVPMSVFRLEGTKILLRRMGEVCKEVAQAEAVFFVPVQSEFEDYQLTIPRYGLLRPDGVHPCARGHYQIARSLWTHLNLGGLLEGDRMVPPEPVRLSVDLVADANILPLDSISIPLTLRTTFPGPVTVSWSSGEATGSERLDLTGTNALDLTLPVPVIPQLADTSSAVVVEIERQGLRRYFVLDLFCKPVLHGNNGEARASITNASGEVICTYRVAREDKALRIEVSVIKDDLIHHPGSMWPWSAGDWLNLLLDLRDPSDFAGLGYDGNVFQVWFTPQEIPMFSPGFIPWAGKHITKLATPYGARTDTGYTVGLLLSGSPNIKESVDYSKRSYIGLDLSLGYVESEKNRSSWGIQKPDRESFLYPGTFTLVDIDGTIPTDTALTLSLFPDPE